MELLPAIDYLQLVNSSQTRAGGSHAGYATVKYDLVKNK